MLNQKIKKLNDSFDLIYKEFQLEQSSTLDEHQLLAMIAERVEWLMNHDMDLLLSYLYRLDIKEDDINRVLMPSELDAPHMGLAKLILLRQKQRMETKKKYKVKPIEGWEF